MPLDIELDRPGGAYAPRDRVAGRVVLRRGEAAEYRSLTIALVCEIFGPATRGLVRTWSSTEKELLPQGAAPQGTSWPFEFELPPVPLSYEGALITVKWELRARADRPQRRDPSVERPITLAADPSAPPVVSEEIVRAAAQAANPLAQAAQSLGGGRLDASALSARMQEMAAQGSAGIEEVRSLASRHPLGPVPPANRTGHELAGLGFLTLLLLVPLRFLYELAAPLDGPLELLQRPAVLLELLAPSNLLDALVPLPLIGGVLAAILFVLSQRSRIAQQKLGDAEVVLDTPIVRRGGSLCCRVRFTPREEVQLEEVSIRIEAEEVIRGGRLASDEVVRRERVAERVGRTLHPGTPEEFEIEIAVPPDAPTTLTADPASVEWRASTSLSIRGWPDLVDDQHIVVTP